MGATGSLRAGSRLAATIEGWEAKPREEGGWRVSVTRTSDRDPYWLENGANFKAALTMGQAELRGRATIVSLEPLVFDLEERVP